MKIQVKLQNTSPIFSATPESASISLDGQLNPPGGGFPYTRTRHEGIMAPDIDGGVVRKMVPIVPGNTMRNLVRRVIMGEFVKPALQSKSAQVSIGAYATMNTGSQSGNPDGVPSTFDEVAHMRNHIFIGLFGGGPRMLRGRLSVETLYPIHHDSLKIIGEHYIDQAARGKITEPVWIRRVDPVSGLNEIDDTKIIVDGIAAANEWISGLLVETKSKGSKDDADSDKNPRGLKAFNAHEVVSSGVDWIWNIRLENPTDAQAGLVLAALSRVGKYSVAGGHGKGYGAVKVLDIAVNGAPVWNESLDVDALDQYLDAMTSELEQLGTEDFETFAASNK